MPVLTQQSIANSIGHSPTKKQPLLNIQPFLRVTHYALQKQDAKAEYASSKSSISDHRFDAIQDILLPAFTGLGFAASVEDVNRKVREWVHNTHFDTILSEFNTLLKAGMVALASKLSSVDDDHLCSRMAEVWSNFYCNIIPNLQSAMAPLRQEPALVQNGKKIDLRRHILVAFRSFVIWPMKSRLIGTQALLTR
ncbi:hypothetical protein HDU91_007456 [Kappamyces sp. JEL0680]|nr:hypothetical protein HDU91_007456 [Kappamyces sp. JEL0680]